MPEEMRMATLLAPDTNRSAEPAAAAAGTAASTPAGARPSVLIPARGGLARPIDADSLAAAVAAYTSLDSMILAPILPAGAIGWFHGPRGIGLTHVMVGCADAIATGFSFLDWTPLRPTPVLLLSGTMSEVALRARIRATSVPGFDARRDANLRVVALGPDRTAVPDLATTSGREALAVLAETCDVIMIDDVAGLLPGNRLDDEAGLWHWLAEQRRTGKTVIVSQASGQCARRRADVAARNVLERLADVVVRLAPVARAKPHEAVNFELHIDRAWHVPARDRAGFEVSLETGANGPQWYLQPIDLSRRERFEAMRATGMSVREAARETGTPRTTAYRWNDDLAAEAERQRKKRREAERLQALAEIAGEIRDAGL
jgi:hypothetical protein